MQHIASLNGTLDNFLDQIFDIHRTRYGARKYASDSVRVQDKLGVLDHNKVSFVM